MEVSINERFRMDKPIKLDEIITQMRSMVLVYYLNGFNCLFDDINGIHVGKYSNIRFAYGMGKPLEMGNIIG